MDPASTGGQCGKVGHTTTRGVCVLPGALVDGALICFSLDFTNFRLI